KAVIGLKPAFDLAVVNMPDNAACRSALKTHPEVLGALADYAAAEAALKLEIARQYPDLKLSNGFQWDQGDKKWQLPGLGVDLPVFHRNQGAIAEAMARRSAAAAKLTSVQARISGDISVAQASLRGAQDQAREAGKLLESERTAEEQSTKSIKAGGGDRLELLTAKVQSAAGRVSLLEAQVLEQQAAAALEDAVQPALTIEQVMMTKLKP
ncbi:MAG: outer membrane protein, partial [Verrucomicrobiaceae bacterium]|nr:outer membrane protein [Verrucomicrobiaceae bacterium]